MAQIVFLPEIDREHTKKKVEEALETTRLYKQIGFIRREMKNTPVYELRLHGPTNHTVDLAGDIATFNVDNETKFNILVERVEKAVSRLNKFEREIIIERYIADDCKYDYEIYNELGYSERKYYRIKSRAFYKLAFMLRLEVYND